MQTEQRQIAGAAASKRSVVRHAGRGCLALLLPGLVIFSTVGGAQDFIPKGDLGSGLKPERALRASLGGAQELSSKDIQAARKLYTAKCAKCHEFYDPKAYRQAEWDGWMQKMRKKSKLKTDQFDLLSRYLDALRSDGETQGKTK